MALKIDKRCNICKLVRYDKKLLKRIYNSSQYKEDGESLKSIQRDPEYIKVFTYQNLYRHSRKHQGIDEETLQNRAAARYAAKLEVQQIKAAVNHTETRQELVDLGVQQLKDGSIKMSASALASLLKQQSDIEEKSKDRQLDIIKMIQRFQSGEKQFMEVESQWQR
jgi:hypothetical protein